MKNHLVFTREAGHGYSFIGAYGDYPVELPDRSATVGFQKNKDGALSIAFHYISPAHKRYGRDLRLPKKQVTKLLKFLDSDFKT